MAQFVGGRFQLIAQLGGGGMADVFLAKLSGKSEFAKLSVVKRLKASEEEDPEIINMFADEARISARLNHPSIVQTFEVGEDENGPFLVMEYIEGQPLGRIRSRAMRRNAPLPRAMALKIIRETVGALAYAHNLVDHDGTLLKVVHRDVSPENIMVTYAGLTKLVDFGVAKTAASMSKTRAGVLKGKVAYMAPEQARSDENIDERVDVFAVGLILWELLTAKRLWEGMSEAKVFERLLDKEPLQRAKEVEPTIPDELDEICAKAIAKDKEERYATAHDLLDALERACGKLDLRASDREMGEFVSGLFEVEREKVKNLVTSSMAKKDDPSSPSGPGLDESDPLLWRGLSSGAHSSPMLLSEKSDASKAESVPTGATTTAAGVSDTKHTAAQLQRKSPVKVILAGGAAVAIVILAVFVGKNMGSTPTPPVVDKPFEPFEPSPVAVVQPPPSSTGETASNDISIDISVKPSNARLTLDGNRVSGNPYHLKTSRGSANHELKAEADGYESRTIMIAFDRDRAIDMNLPKVAYAVPSPSGRPPGSTPPSTTTPATTTAPVTPTPTTPTTAKGITEMDPTKPKSGKQDKLDTDVFKR